MKEKGREVLAAALEDAARQHEAKLKRREEALKTVEAIAKHRDLRRTVPPAVKERMNAIVEEVKTHRVATFRQRDRVTKELKELRNALGIEDRPQA
jgi:hypothetical protein